MKREKPAHPQHNRQSSAGFISKFTDGDQVIVLGEYRGRGKASGTAFQVPVITVYGFRDGKWIRFQEYADTGTIAAALK